MFDAKTHPFAVHGKILGHPIVAGTKSIGFHWAERLFRCATERRPGFFRVAPNHHFSTSGHKIHEPAKSELIALKVGINVRVIVFQGGNDQVVGMIMKKFWAAVPKRGFVLVSLENKLLATAEAVAL